LNCACAAKRYAHFCSGQRPPDQANTAPIALQSTVSRGHQAGRSLPRERRRGSVVPITGLATQGTTYLQNQEPTRPVGARFSGSRSSGKMVSRSNAFRSSRLSRQWTEAGAIDELSPTEPPMACGFSTPNPQFSPCVGSAGFHSTLQFIPRVGHFEKRCRPIYIGEGRTQLPTRGVRRSPHGTQGHALRTKDRQSALTEALAECLYTPRGHRRIVSKD
jgi:hypothetical protein